MTHGNAGKLLLLASLFVLAGCGSDEPQDVREWMAEQTKDLKAQIPDLPQIKSLPPIVYEPGDAVQPFAGDKLFAEEAKAAQEGRNGGPKQVNADAYPLARVPLESIRLLGTMIVGKETIAIVQSDRDASRKVRIGDYIGQNNGRIVAIKMATQDDGEIVIKEKVLDKGVWVERETRITTSGQGEKK
ncbi:MAG TPA: pilus assembly protein PilP [Rhodocyclaceae bacterium]|nr:pilus assembly protein PilP [Rhodocyclaceae bacterium]